MILPALALATFVAWLDRAEAAPRCGKTELIFEILRTKHNETPVAGGLSSKIGSTVLAVSPVGGWTIVKFYGPNRVCIVDAGKGWYFYKGEPPKIYAPGSAPS